MITELEELAGTYSDLYKDVHGFRPRHIGYDKWSVEQFRKEIDELSKELTGVMAEEDRVQCENVVKFESRINDTIRMGARDRETALRWIHAAEGTSGDDDYLCFVMNIPYGYFSDKRISS